MIAGNESATTNGKNGAAGCSRIFTTDGHPLNGIWATSMGYSGHTNKGRKIESNTEQASILNPALVQDGLYSGHNEVFEALTIYGLPQGLCGTLTLIASRAANDSIRKGDF
ncbi:hypothetical protein [Larsenimonas salina]|uniref:hypothetical protein n=1 Tax=Larsenimonas salina TaxID=1295565 RepID=UPI002072F0DD|nr:hypothetical protein [Larsenimonas salina]MCM5703392.1 hypothetical protein [Larsenimonas salina]